MSILEMNGSGLVCMVGDGCVGIASDKRFGVQQLTVGEDQDRIFKMNDKTLLGLSGLVTDVMTVKQKLEQSCNMYKLREDRDMKPSVFNNMLSSFLYARRFGPYFVEPLVAGLEGPDNKPFIAGQDLLGASVFTNDFLVCGTSEKELYGTCESFYKPNLNPDELFETLSQCLLAGIDRDCLAGWGAKVYILTKDELRIKVLKGRHD